MKLIQTVAVLASLTAAVVGQGINIWAPTTGQTVQAGSDIIVTVNRPDTLTPSDEIGIAITIQHCQENPCEDVTEDLGDVLFHGPFNPQFAAGGSHQPDFEPFQNYTVSIPSTLATGPAVISVPHAALVGAGPFFLAQIVNVTVTVV